MTEIKITAMSAIDFTTCYDLPDQNFKLICRGRINRPLKNLIDRLGAPTEKIAHPLFQGAMLNRKGEKIFCLKVKPPNKPEFLALIDTLAIDLEKETCDVLRVDLNS